MTDDQLPSAEKGAGYRCCPHCADALTDHVEHGGTVERDGHDVPCSTCEYEQRTLPLLASAYDLAANAVPDREQRSAILAANPYRPLPPGGGDRS